MGFKKRTKSSRHAGSQTHGRGAKERTRASGNRGGYGLAGTGKRADQKKTYFLNQTGGNNYFGKDRALRRGNLPSKLKVINLGEISEKYAGQKEVDLKGYKILGSGDLKIKIKISASSASQSAIEKAKSAGSEILLAELDSEN